MADLDFLDRSEGNTSLVATLLALVDRVDQAPRTSPSRRRRWPW